MARIELTDAEAEALRELLESGISDLRYEVNNTDSHDYKVGLKAKQSALEAIAKRLAAG